MSKRAKRAGREKKSYQVALDELVDNKTMALWEKGQLAPRRPWRGATGPVRPIHVPSGLIKLPETGDFWEDV